MPVSVIIPIYSRTEWIEKCLQALSVQENLQNYGAQILVIDDGSPNADQIRLIVERFRDKLNVAYFYQQRRGPAVAKNSGIYKSKGEIICFIDDDSICDKYWLNHIVNAFREDSSVGIVSGKILSFRREPGCLGLLLQESVYKPKKRWATSNIAYRREVLNRVGVFDESYKLASWEDNDLGFRGWLAGVKHKYSPQALVYHSHEETLSAFSEKSLRNGLGLGQFARKFFLFHPLIVTGIIALVIRDIYLIIHPNVFLVRRATKEFLRFSWAFNSLKGCCEGLLRCRQELLNG